ncbi:MAG: hypothetical protein Q8P40_12255 [Nitrospirota bacterium]|nr:hypothetical protein [Nitrospirota bacterium]
MPQPKHILSSKFESSEIPLVFSLSKMPSHFQAVENFACQANKKLHGLPTEIFFLILRKHMDRTDISRPDSIL